MPSLRPTASTQRAAAREADVSTLADLLGARMHVDTVIPRTKIALKLRLCSRREEHEVKGEARQAMSDAGYPVNGEARQALGAIEQWQIEVAVRMLAIAARSPSDVSEPLASIDEWRECDDMQILALWAEYADLSARLDPVASGALTDDEMAGLTSAAKKKDADLLMLFGSRRLALFAITSADQPASSATPTSTSGLSPS